MKHPDFRELVGDDLSPEEELRLRRAHDLLVAAGPPPELPPTLVSAPDVRGAPEVDERERLVALGLPPRRRGRLVALVAGFAAAAFLAGYIAGNVGGRFDTDYSVTMRATDQARGASAVIDIGELDDAGNWPLRLKVRGLPALPEGGYYELFLTQGRKLAVSCGTFRVEPGTTEVRLNAPYRFRDYDRWVVTAHLPGKGERERPLLTAPLDTA